METNSYYCPDCHCTFHQNVLLNKEEVENIIALDYGIKCALTSLTIINTDIVTDLYTYLKNAMNNLSEKNFLKQAYFRYITEKYHLPANVDPHIVGNYLYY